MHEESYCASEAIVFWSLSILLMIDLKSNCPLLILNGSWRRRRRKRRIYGEEAGDYIILCNHITRNTHPHGLPIQSGRQLSCRGNEAVQETKERLLLHFTGGERHSKHILQKQEVNTMGVVKGRG